MGLAVRIGSSIQGEFTSGERLPAPSPSASRLEPSGSIDVGCEKRLLTSENIRFGQARLGFGTTAGTPAAFSVGSESLVCPAHVSALGLFYTGFASVFWSGGMPQDLLYSRLGLFDKRGPIRWAPDVAGGVAVASGFSLAVGDDK